MLTSVRQCVYVDSEVWIGAGDGSRTRDILLGRPIFTVPRAIASLRGDFLFRHPLYVAPLEYTPAMYGSGRWTQGMLRQMALWILGALVVGGVVLAVEAIF